MTQKGITCIFWVLKIKNEKIKLASWFCWRPVGGFTRYLAHAIGNKDRRGKCFLVYWKDSRQGRRGFHSICLCFSFACLHGVNLLVGVRKYLSIGMERGYRGMQLWYPCKLTCSSWSSGKLSLSSPVAIPLVLLSDLCCCCRPDLSVEVMTPTAGDPVLSGVRTMWHSPVRQIIPLKIDIKLLDSNPVFENSAISNMYLSHLLWPEYFAHVSIENIGTLCYNLRKLIGKLMTKICKVYVKTCIPLVNCDNYEKDPGTAHLLMECINNWQQWKN